MKIILSRKGFDSGSGGIPSPILPDGTLLSMPIPSDDLVSYEDLNYGHKTYSSIIRELSKSFDDANCHLDPDIREMCTARDEQWTAAFGQSDAALTHLNNNGIAVGDIFLFFGWFKQTEYGSDGKLKFVRNAPDLHIIYGYLQIGEILDNYDKIKEVYWHPHAGKKYENDKLNTIYLPSKNILDLNLKGYGIFNYSDELVLTKAGHPRSHWDLPECLLSKKISYHKESNFKGNYFQSAMRGQEFVVDVDDDILKWVKNILHCCI